MFETEKAYMEASAGGQLGPMRESRRQHLNRRKAELNRQLQAVQKAIDALDSHPELEEFIETLTNAGA